MMDTIPPISPPLPKDHGWQRVVPVSMALVWLKRGWIDCWRSPITSIIYGVACFLVSLAVIVGLFLFKLDYILFPALSGFMIVGPVIALGLYEKSKLLEAGRTPGLHDVILVRPASGGQVIFAGVLLALLLLLWMRAAVLLYAIFFGLVPFLGFEQTALVLFQTFQGWALIIVGIIVGGLFAGFSFAISVFALPMLQNERTDALTAMGTSMALVWNNLPVMLAWGAMVMALFVLSIATGFVGLIVVFPVLGHATWHAYRTMRPDPTQDAFNERPDLKPGFHAGL